MRTLPLHLPVLVAFMVIASPAQAADFPDLAVGNQPPRKEPAYTATKPLYGLARFGPSAGSRVWMVLDKSKADAKTYDILHIDRNADGDLTGPGERLTRGKDDRFRVGDFKDPATGAAHTEFTVRTTAEVEPELVMLSLRWRGGFKFGGGYPQDPAAGYLRFAARPEDAPVVWVNADAPFRFQHWDSGKLTIGKADDFKVFLGQPGRGRASFCAAQEHILPAGEFATATLVYRDGMGKEKRIACELKERC